MRRWRYPFSLIGLSGFFLLLILSRIPSLQAAEILTIGVVNPDSLYGEVGVDFNVQFTATGGTPPYTFTQVSGTLPDGVFFTGGTLGVITDKPIEEGQYTINVQAAEQANSTNTSPSTPFTLCVGILMSPSTLPNITATVAYTPVTITSTCAKGAVTYELTGAPTGITIDATTGVISGTTIQEGPFTLRVKATDSLNRVSFKDYPVTSAYPALNFNPSTVPSGFKDVTYPTTTVTFSGRPGPYTISLLTGVGETKLPAGMPNPVPTATGFTLSGKPTVTGTDFQVVVKVIDANLREEIVTFPFTVSIPSLTITPETLPNATVGVPYNQQLTVSGGTGPYFFSLSPDTTLPANLSLLADGRINGTPTATPKTYIFTVIVTDSSNPQRTGTKVYSLSLVGNGAAYGSIPGIGSTIYFPPVAVPGTDVLQQLFVFNSGPSTLTVSAPGSGLESAFTGPNAGDFRFFQAPPGSGISFPTFDVLPGKSTSVVIICRPTSTLFVSVATMTFKTNDPIRPSVSYELRCNAAAPPSTPGVGTPTAIAATAGPSVVVLGRATGFVTETPDTFARLTFVKGLALRSGPYLGATMLGVLKREKDYPVLAVNGGDGEGNFNWYMIIDDESKRVGWASGRYLILSGDPNIAFTPTIFDQIDNTQDVGARLTIFGNVNIRVRPSDRMPVIHTTAYGTELEIIGRTQQAGVPQWLHVRFFDPSGRAVIGWVSYKFNAPELMKLTGIAPLDAVPIR